MADLAGAAADGPGAGPARRGAGMVVTDPELDPDPDRPEDGGVHAAVDEVTTPVLNRVWGPVLADRGWLVEQIEDPPH